MAAYDWVLLSFIVGGAIYLLATFTAAIIIITKAEGKETE